MRQLLLCIYLLLFHSICIGQNNSIFGGGIADGDAEDCQQQVHQLAPNNSLFSGGISAGASVSCYSQANILPVNSLVFRGGDRAGETLGCDLQEHILPVNSISFGGGVSAGETQGCDLQTYVLPQNSVAFLGGNGDGEAEDCAIDVLIPSNDQICGALELRGASLSGSFNSFRFFDEMSCSSSVQSNAEATAIDAIEASCGGVNGRSLWYTFTTPECLQLDGSSFGVEISTNFPETNVDTKIELFSTSNNECDGVITSLACNDNHTDSLGSCANIVGASSLYFGDLTANTKYYVLVDVVGGSAIGTYAIGAKLDVTPTAIQTGFSDPGRIHLALEDVGATYYYYYTRRSDLSGYTVKTKPSSEHDVNGLPGSTYFIQGAYRCNGLTPTKQFFRTPIDTVVLDSSDACEGIVDLQCSFATQNSINVSWTEQEDVYNGANGNLSGYIIYYRKFGAAGLSILSNPSVSCLNGSCNYTIQNLVEGESYEIFLRSRCTRFITRLSNVVVCATSGGMARPDNLTFSFNNGDWSYHDVRLSDDWNNFEVELDSDLYMDVSNGEIQLESLESRQNTLALNTVAFEMYPNPTKGTTTLRFTSSERNKKCTVSNMQGKLLQEYIASAGSTSLSIETSALPAGIYFICLEEGDLRISKKLVVL